MNTRLTACFLLLACVPAVAGAQDLPVAQCTLCTWPTGITGQWLLDAGHVSDSSARFGDYRGLGEAGAYLALSGTAAWLGEDGRYLQATARDLGLDNHQLRLRIGQPGAWEFRLRASGVPHVYGSDGRTPFTGIGGTRLTLPGNWQPAFTTRGMSELRTNLVPAALEVQRDVLELGLSLLPATRWRWDLNLQHQEKTGTRPFGAGVFTLNTSQLPAPVDWQTDTAALSVSYTAERGALAGGAQVSRFDNNAEELSWDNPFTPLAGTDLLLASLAPDNRHFRAWLNGAWSASPGLRLTGRVQLGESTQNAAFLPYTSNTEIETPPLPRESLQGEIDQASLSLAGSADLRLARRLDLALRLNIDDRDNQSPVNEWTPVVTDFYLRPATFNRPYDFRREQAGLELRYRTRAGNRLRGGFNVQQVDRSLQSVSSTDEDELWLESGFNAGARLSARLRLEHADRDGSGYAVVIDPGLPENPLQRKFHLADRQRDLLRLAADFAASAELSISAQLDLAEDRYTESPLGLQHSELRGWNLDLAWTPQAGRSLHAWAAREDFDSSIVGQADFLLPWTAESRDQFDSLGVQLELQISPRTQVTAGAGWHASGNNIHTRSVTTGGPLPEVKTDLSNVRLELRHAGTAAWEWRAAIEHENYRSADWHLDGLDVDGIPAVLALGLVSPDYDVTVLLLSAGYRF